VASRGWIRLYRKIQECAFLWDSTDEPFDRRSAWIDLLLLANHEDKRMNFGGKGITVSSGQRITSMRILADRWHWSREKVRRYLDSLAAEGMIIRESDEHKTLVTIVNYEVYQSYCATDDATNESTDEPQTSHTRATLEPQTSINKNDKNDKNEKNDKEGTTTPIPYQEIVELYNSICVSFPMVKNLSKARKAAIGARYKHYDLNDFRLLFQKAEESDFLKGNNKNNWSANFDWLIRDTNMPKVLEGLYENKQKKSSNETANKLSEAYEMMRAWAEE